MNEKFIEYEPVRDVVLVLGAGASYADGAFKKGAAALHSGRPGSGSWHASEIAQGVSRFIQEISGSSPAFIRAWSWCSVIWIISSSTRRASRRQQHLPNSGNQGILIKLIHYVIGHKPRAYAGVYHRFWETIRQSNRNISILTLNYDTLLDEAFNFLYPDYAYIDYCIHLMNFDYTDEIGWANWWRDVRKPVPSNPVPIPDR